jgi:hypothetical protein
MAEIVYVLFNAGMPTLSRVGVLEDGGSPSDLMVEIYNENVPLPYECVYACIAKDSTQAERAVYEKFAAQHIGRYGDFMDVIPESIVEVLLPYESEDVTESFRISFDSTLDDGEKEAREHYTALRRPKRTKPSDASGSSS